MTCRSTATVPGKSAREVMPAFRQIFVEKPTLAGDELERHVYVARKHIEHVTAMLGGRTVYFPSLSARVVCYKGMLTPDQLQRFYRDLQDPRVETALALVHSRFSTNTFPSWPLAHPYRMLAHNGEINTVQGNENWMRAREGVMQSDLLPGDLDACVPDLHARLVRHRALRRSARAAQPRGPAAAPRDPHDDPRGVGEPRGDGRRAQGVLPLPRGADGAVGRSRRRSRSPTAP